MNVVFITINDQHFLPRFFENFFSKANIRDSFKALLVRPTYKNETIFSMAMKYLKTFGLKEMMYFSFETLSWKILDVIRKPDKNRKSYSVKADFKAYDHEAVSTDKSVNGKFVLDKLENWSTDVIVSIGCPQIFKEKLINLPSKGCLNLHGSPLPSYRGVLPSFWMLKNNEKYAANTIFFVNKKIDGGDILLQESFAIEGQDTLRSLILKSKLAASEMTLNAIELIRSGDFITHPIDVSEGSYFHWPTRKDVLEFLNRGKKLR
ncbi:MAG: formyltransferase family protein [Candidatus Odinarchaeota archaeon]